MIRILLEVIVPLILPTALYLAWLAHARARARRLGQPEPEFGAAPWVWLIGCGVVFAGAVVAGLALMGGMPPQGRYVPPQTGPGGQVIPGHIEPRR
jgi:hypothetical protein